MLSVKFINCLLKAVVCKEATFLLTLINTIDYLCFHFITIMKYVSGKFSASKVRLAEAPPKPPRPERLRLRSTCDTNNGPTVMVLRQPRGPSDNAVVHYFVCFPSFMY